MGPEAAVAAPWGVPFAVRPHSYDHGRSHMLKETSRAPSVRLPIWDFVVHRADGASIRLRLEWSKPRCTSFAAEGHGEVVQAPRAGLGRSDGRGAFDRYKIIANQETLHFAARR